MIKFLRVACYRIEVVDKIEALSKRVSHVQFRFRLQLISVKSRSENLQKLLADEAFAYQSELAKSKNKESIALSKQFRHFNWDYGFKVLEWYLKRCR